MISRVQLLRNIGQFDSVAPGVTTAFNKLTLIYAENGRGKTTLASIFRSAGEGDAASITERKRLGSNHDPHIVIETSASPPPTIFQGGAWNGRVSEVVVFDDRFVDANVCSGLEVLPGHRQNLHELILGAQGVTLTVQLQSLVENIEEHNRAIKAKAEAIPAQIRGPFSVDDFVALQVTDDIDNRITSVEKQLAAVRQAEPVRTGETFLPLSLPSIFLDEISRILGTDLPGLEARAVAKVQKHVEELGRGAEAWISDGMERIKDQAANDCPFCTQNLAGSEIVDHYRGYFGHEYADLKRLVHAAGETFSTTHSADILAAFERSVRLNSDRHRFWSQFCDLPEFQIDTAALGLVWRTSREGITHALQEKEASPLEGHRLRAEVLESVRAYGEFRVEVERMNTQAEQSNTAITLVKEQAAQGDIAILERDLERLRAVKRRFTADVTTACSAWMLAKAQKAVTEALRDQAKEQLRQYRDTAFPHWQNAINTYLRYFNTGFRLESVAAVDTRGGPACNYAVVVNNVPVPVHGAAAAGAPSFKTALSTGDRNTLALAFFLATLDRDPNLANRIVVIDDPITSLDDHRTMSTVSHIRSLVNRTAQVIVLSHSKPFLCRLSDHPDKTVVKAIQVGRTATGSELVEWNVTQDCLTEHDRRHELLRSHIVTPGANSREVARALRPTIEAFFRVAYPDTFPPNTLLGPFRGICDQRVGTPAQILDGADTHELRELTDYANRFHHDTNQAWETEQINDLELLGFVERVLAFSRR